MVYRIMYFFPTTLLYFTIYKYTIETVKEEEEKENKYPS